MMQRFLCHANGFPGEAGMTIATSKKLSVGDNHADGLPDRRVFGGRYQVLKTLKNAHDTETLLASDLTQGSTVVIKTTRASSFSATARMRLDHEAHVLSQIQNGRFAPLL